MMKARLRWALMCLACGLAIFLASLIAHADSIREVRVTSGTLISIHTAIGYSTILEFQSKPVSAVLGDQDAFHLEYLGNSIALKPVIQGAKTNLFVYSAFERFNFSIQTGAPSHTDYIVKIFPKSNEAKSNDPPPPDDDPYQSILINKASSLRGFQLKVDQIKVTKDHANPRSASLIDFDLSTSKNDYVFQASSMGIKQNGKFLGAESIYLGATELKPNRGPVHGVIALLNQEWNRKLPITLVFAFEIEKQKKKQTNRINVTFSPIKLNSKKEGSNGKIDLFPTVVQPIHK